MTDKITTVMQFSSRSFVLASLVFAGPANAICLPSNEILSMCRYEAGDSWCAENDAANRFAYEDGCLAKLTLPSVAENSDQLSKLRQNMSYSAARELILSEGWQSAGTPWGMLGSTMELDIHFKNGWRELVSCAGTGLSPCRYEFSNIRGETLVAITEGECHNDKQESLKAVQICDLPLVRWFLE